MGIHIEYFNRSTKYVWERAGEGEGGEGGGGEGEGEGEGGGKEEGEGPTQPPLQYTLYSS